MNKALQAHLALLIVNVIYGANYSIAKEVMPAYVQPFAFVLMRVAGAAVLFWLVSAVFIKEKLDKKDLPKIVLLALFGVTINQLLFLKGLSLTTPINASIIMISNPIVVLIFAAIALKEKISFGKIAGIALGISGALLLLLFNKSFSFGSDTITGDAMVLINSLSWAGYIILVKPLMKKYNTFTIVKWVFLLGTVFVLPFGYGEFTEIKWGLLPSPIWWDIAFVVIGTTFIAYILNTYALRSLSPSVVSIYIYLQPFLATLIAIFYYHNDELDARKLTSGILIVLGVYLVSRPGKAPNSIK
ncbi:MAG: EamA family transporter [Bacteroidia bacterium]